MYNNICKNCGKEFFSGRKRTYCCNECYKVYIKNHKIIKPSTKENRIEVVCLECGKHEFVTPCRAKKYKTCSRECLAKYNSKRYSKKVKKTCIVCGKEFECKLSSVSRRKTCSRKCLSIYKSEHQLNENNPNSILYRNSKNLIKVNKEGYHTDIHKAIVKSYFKLRKLPKGYHIHHKDANHFNNDLENLVLLPQDIHMLIHRIFGNVLINALHTNRIDKDTFFKICDEKQAKFYNEIIDLNITNQAVVKQGELLENLGEDNQQPSIYRNVYEGSTTNSRDLTDNA